MTKEDETPESTKDIKRQRFDTTGSIRYLTDSEEEDAEDKGIPNRLISLDDDLFMEDSADSTHSASQDSEEGNRLVATRKSLVPPSSLVLSVALDEIDLHDKSDVQETPVSQRLSLSSSLTSSQTSLASSGGEAAGNKRSMLPRLPSLRLKKPSNPVVPEVIKTKYHYVDPEEIIPTVPMPDLKRVVKWENVTIRNIEYQIDEAVVQPYKKVIAHGGFYDTKSTIIEVFLPYLPAANVQHYDWIMDNLFLYVLATVELLAQGKFSVVIFVGPKSHIPANALLRRWHQHVEYRLKKNVEAFYIVNPTFYFKTMARLFVSRKVNKKMRYVKSLAELGTFIPTDFLFVPPEIAK